MTNCTNAAASAPGASSPGNGEVARFQARIPPGPILGTSLADQGRQEDETCEG